MTQSKSSKQPAGKAAGASPIIMRNVTPASDSTAAFLKEVDDALQQERMLNLWNSYKWFIAVAVVVAVALVAGEQAWKAWNDQKARTLAAKWYAFSELKTDAERKVALPELLQTTTDGPHALAVYAQASMQHTGMEKARAYEQVVNSADAPGWLKDLARLNEAIALLDEKPEQAKTQLELLAQTDVEEQPSPAYAPALELLALIAQKDGDVNAAKGYTKKILTMEGVPADMRQRALQRYGALGGE